MITGYRFIKPLPADLAEYELYLDGDVQEFRSTQWRYAPPIPAEQFMEMLAKYYPDYVEAIEVSDNPMTRRQAIDYLASETYSNIRSQSANREERDAGVEDTYRAFEALGVSRKEVDGEAEGR